MDSTNTDFTPLLPVDQLVEGLKQSFKVGDINLLLIHYRSKTHLIENRCGHFGVPMTNAILIDGTIECKQHYIRFDLKSGNVVKPDMNNCDPIRVFEVSVVDGMVGVYSSILNS